MEGPDDVLELMDSDTGAEGVVALVRDAGATFLAPLYHELTAVVCTAAPSQPHRHRQQGVPRTLRDGTVSASLNPRMDRGGGRLLGQ